MNSDILYLLNPLSNEGYAAKNWQKSVNKFPDLPQYPVDITAISDLTSFIHEKNPKIIAIAGGDGTVNSVCNAILKLRSKPILAVLPFGFGNALALCLGVENIRKAVYVLREKPSTVTIDILKTNIVGKKTGIFSISVGYEARIIHIRNNYRYIGVRSYILSAIRGFLQHPEKEIRFTIDHAVTLNATASSLVIANCPVIGHNYVVSPHAKLNDGFLDCTLFSTKYAYLTNLRLKGFKHPLYSEIGKVHFKARHIRVEGEPFLQIDGDPVMERSSIEVEIFPRQLTFLRNTKENIDIAYDPFVS